MAGTYSITVQEARGLVAVSSDIDQLAMVLGCTSTASGSKGFFASGQSAAAACGKGDAVDTLCQIIEQKQSSGNGVKRPAGMYSLPTVTAASYGTVDSTAKTGTSAVTMDAATLPYGTYEAYLRVVTGGTIGTPGIALVWSLDNGRSESQVVQLGNATGYTITDGNVEFAFGTGTLVAGDIVRVRTVAPAPDSAGIAAAFTALAASSYQFSLVVCDFEMTPTLAATVSQGKAALINAGKRVSILARTRLPDAATSETDAAWNTDTATDYLSVSDSAIHLRASYGLVTDSMTGRQYLRSDLQQFAADVVRVPRSVWPNCPNDQPMANLTLVNSSGATVGHDEGPRGSSTGLSNDTLGNRFGCVMRLPDPTRLEDVFTTVPWVLYSADERIRNLPTRRVVNAIARVAVAAGTTQLGGRFKYTPATGTTPATLSAEARRAIHGKIFAALATEFRDDISNATDAALDTGLVQVNPAVTVTGGNLLSVPVTIAPVVFGYLLNLSITVAVQL